MAYLPDEAVERSHELTGGAFKLYAYLCKLRNNKTGICWPRGRTAAAELHVDHSRIVRWRKELIDLGWIEFERPTSVTRPLIGFPSHGAKSAPEVMSKAHHAGAETAPPHGTKSAPRNCEKRTAHIRTEPAHEPAHEEKSSSSAALSRFSIEECRKFVLSEAPHARSPGALARFIHRTGEDDDKMAAFFERGGRKETWNEHVIRITKLAADLEAGRSH